ncbi:HD domain-containing protein [Candidatus Pacearchaeota archaeon]|nr:HD domain-containing protein [Candidatus Pacearchaeota archaeon]
MTKAETIFQKELNQIHDKDIKQFAITCFDKLCPDYFWTCPCSTTGKYHPQVSLGVGGLVRHTKLAVWWGIELLEALGPSPELNKIPTTPLRDEVIATLLLHDMIKNGKGLNAQGYPLNRGVTGTHGVTLAKKIIRSDLSIDDSNDRIIVGIAGHMGIWTTDDYFRPDNIINPTQKAFAQLIHLADYCASRKVDEIYRKLQGERDDLIKTTAEIIKETVSQSPPCPGVRKTESRQTTAAENGQ